MKSHLLAMLLAALVAATASADTVVIKKGKNRYDFLGLRSRMNGVEVTIENWQAFADEGNAVVERVGYDAVWVKPRANSRKAEKYPLSSVVEIRYTTEPDNLLAGYDLQSTGAWGRAIGAFRAVANNNDARPVYRVEAQFQIGVTYLRGGSSKQALDHFQKWTIEDSKYTPVVYRLVGDLLTQRKKYAEARSWFEKIGALPDISEDWKLKARLGGVRVDIAERKFDEAENNARAIARAAESANANDSLAGAYALQASAMLASGNKDKFPAAQKLAEQAVALEGVTDSTMAVAYSGLGDIIYAQGKPEDARFAYMRVVLLYPEESGHVAHSLENAGQCFIDMADRAKDDQAKHDDLLVKGIKLMRECYSRHRGSGSARTARSVYRKRKADYEAALARLEKK